MNGKVMNGRLLLINYELIDNYSASMQSTTVPFTYSPTCQPITQ